MGFKVSDVTFFRTGERVPFLSCSSMNFSLPVAEMAIRNTIVIMDTANNTLV